MLDNFVITERSAIKQRMKEIQEERRALSQEYWGMMERLRELDDIEREHPMLVDPTALIAQLLSTVSELKSLIPTPSIDQVLDYMKKQGVAQQIQEIHEETTTSTVTTTMISSKDLVLEQQKSESTRSVKRVHRDMLKDQSYVVVEVMEAFGRPVRLKDIMSQLKEKDIETVESRQATNWMRNLMELNPRIQKAPSFGMYQLKY